MPTAAQARWCSPDRSSRSPRLRRRSGGASTWSTLEVRRSLISGKANSGRRESSTRRREGGGDRGDHPSTDARIGSQPPPPPRDSRGAERVEKMLEAPPRRMRDQGWTSAACAAPERHGHPAGKRPRLHVKGQEHGRRAVEKFIRLSAAMGQMLRRPASLRAGFQPGRDQADVLPKLRGELRTRARPRVVAARATTRRYYKQQRAGEVLRPPATDGGGRGEIATRVATRSAWAAPSLLRC